MIKVCNDDYSFHNEFKGVKGILMGFNCYGFIINISHRITRIMHKMWKCEVVIVYWVNWKCELI